MGEEKIVHKLVKKNSQKKNPRKKIREKYSAQNLYTKKNNAQKNL